MKSLKNLGMNIAGLRQLIFVAVAGAGLASMAQATIITETVYGAVASENNSIAGFGTAAAVGDAVQITFTLDDAGLSGSTPTYSVLAANFTEVVTDVTQNLTYTAPSEAINFVAPDASNTIDYSLGSTSQVWQGSAAYPGSTLNQADLDTFFAAINASQTVALGSASSNITISGASNTPEPSTNVLMLVGAAGLFYAIRRRKLNAAA
jgi:hypothetical protein